MKDQREAMSNPSRRDLITARFPRDITARPSRDTGHIASLMVQAWPEYISELTPTLNAIPGVEVHASEENGRMVVTIEADSDSHLLDTITHIERTDHVVTASLVYHQIED